MAPARYRLPVERKTNARVLTANLFRSGKEEAEDPLLPLSAGSYPNRISSLALLFSASIPSPPRLPRSPSLHCARDAGRPRSYRHLCDVGEFAYTMELRARARAETRCIGRSHRGDKTETTATSAVGIYRRDKLTRFDRS